MANVSKPIETFLDFLRETEQQYHMAEATETEANGLIQDALHSLEFEEHTYNEYAKLAKELKSARVSRRTAKDTMSQTLPILEWVDANRTVVRSLERLLGDVRKAERNTENRIYTPRKQVK